MDRHGDMQEYHRAKHRIFLGCGAVVFNRDDSLSRPLQADTVPSWSFGLGVPDRHGYGLVEHEGESWICREFTPVMPVREVRLAGRHNLANGLAALALGEVLGLAQDSMLEALRSFAGLPHRTQLVAEANGLRFINDSKATNPGATLAALRGFEEEIVLILGGQGKDADFSELCREAPEHCRAVVLIGEDAPLLDAALPETLPRLTVESMDAAVAAAVDCAQPGDIVLLSPACASFDMYSGFAARGEAFGASVRKILAEAGA